ncbi:hypothetical protein HDU97_008523 [Phlyctochytrium planicorne]|nr:hypothetical protein HDU97_008523 [Phlyctochytrium planicorne]
MSLNRPWTRCLTTTTHASPAAKILGIKATTKPAASFKQPSKDSKPSANTTPSSAFPSTSTVKSSKPTPPKPVYNDKISEALASSPDPTSTLTTKVKDAFGTSFVQPMLDIFAGITQLHTRVNKTLVNYIAYMTNGEKVTSRSGMAYVRRTKRDFLTALPAAIYLCLPLQKWTLPLVFRQFPYFVSSVYMTQDLVNNKNTVIERKRVGISNGLVDALVRDLEKSKKNKMDAVSMARLVKLQGMLKNRSASTLSDLLEFGPFFRDHFSLINIGYLTAAKSCAFLGMGMPMVIPKSQLYRWASWTVTDNDLIRTEGINRLTDFEVNEAVEEQGLVALSGSSDRLRLSLKSSSAFTRTMAESFMRTRGLQLGQESLLLPEEISAVGIALVIARALKLERFE